MPEGKDHRALTTIRRQIAEIERYLVDVPPHSGSGHRDELIAKLAELRRELAELTGSSS